VQSLQETLEESVMIAAAAFAGAQRPTRTGRRKSPRSAALPSTARTHYKGGSKYQPSAQDRRTVAAMISVGNAALVLPEGTAKAPPVVGLHGCGGPFPSRDGRPKGA
jgi:hypothetical protein